MPGLLQWFSKCSCFHFLPSLPHSGKSVNIEVSVSLPHLLKLKTLEIRDRAQTPFGSWGFPQSRLTLSSISLLHYHLTLSCSLPEVSAWTKTSQTCLLTSVPFTLRFHTSPHSMSQPATFFYSLVIKPYQFLRSRWSSTSCQKASPSNLAFINFPHLWTLSGCLWSLVYLWTHNSIYYYTLFEHFLGVSWIFKNYNFCVYFIFIESGGHYVYGT